MLVLLATFAPVVDAQPLEVTVVSLTSPVQAGGDATLAVETAAGANCQITVRYKSGPSRTSGLVPKMADDWGRVSWTWRVGSRTTPGTWPITVSCSAGGRQGTLWSSFVVR